MDLATSLNLMNERTMMAALSAEQPAVDYDKVVDTLAHIWLTSIYGEVPTTRPPPMRTYVRVGSTNRVCEHPAR